MLSKYRHYSIKCAYILLDIIVLVIGVYLACSIRHTTLPFDITFKNIFLSAQNPFRFIFVLWGVATILFVNSNQLYQTKRGVFRGFEFGLILKSVLLSCGIVIVAIYVLKIEGFPRTVLFIGSAFNTIGLSLWRLLKRIYVSYLVRNGYNNFNVLIVGAGRVGNALANEMKDHRDLGMKVVGFLDDFKSESDILGKLEDVEKVIKREFIDKIFITIHHDSAVFLNLIEKAKELRIGIHVVPQGFDLMSKACVNYHVGIIPVLEYCNQIPLQKQFGKRLFDFVFTFGGLVFLCPVFFIIAVLIKLDSKGPIFYASRRYGRNGRFFKMHKFRSMTTDADERLVQLKNENEVDGPIFKMRNDPRITRVGRILRKYSLDELPQLINVLVGEMSLVGPRPLPIDQVEREDLFQLKRLEVRPGITGLWQIKGRSDLSFKKLIKFDIWYINNWSFWLDLNILFQTLPAVVKAKGAY